MKKNRLTYIKEGMKNMKGMGTIMTSSRYLCKSMLKDIDFDKARLLVELGSGDGVVTHHILKRMHPEAKLISFEVNELFFPFLDKIKDPRFILVKDSAEKLSFYLKEYNLGTPDHIISALPYLMMPKDVTKNIMAECVKNLKQGGLYVQMHYALKLKQMYKDAFGNVDVNFVPLNIPPAFVLTSIKDKK